jgi:glycosyltransferase involved in cell wall biosynthesis
MAGRKKIIRTATVPLSLDLFCRGLLRDLSSRYEIIALSSPQPELDSIRKREKVRTISVPMARKIAPFSDLKSLFELIRVFRKERPDMVHSITPKAGLLSMMAAKWTRVPVRIHTFTGLIFPYEKGWKRRLLMTTDRLTASCATHVIPEGVGIRDDLIRFKITRKPLRVLGNGNVRGIDLSHYVRTEKLSRSAADLRNYYNIPDEGFAFIFVGRLDRDKGIDELVQAFLKLEQDYPNVHLFLVGAEEPEGKSIQDETKEIIARDDHIHLSDGWQADVRPWYAAADALVHPSRREGFPNVVIEAGAMGLASIVTDINGSREIVKDGQNGTIVPAQDPEAMYAAMKDFLDHPEKVQEMAAAARDLSKRYEQKYVRQCLDVFYKEVLR